MHVRAHRLDQGDMAYDFNDCIQAFPESGISYLPTLPARVHERIAFLHEVIETAPRRRVKRQSVGLLQMFWIGGPQ